MADLFDINEVNAGIAQALEQQRQAQVGYMETLGAATEVVNRSNQTFADQMQQFNQQSTAAYDNAAQALERLEAIDSNPNFVNKVMSLFDSDFDRDVQTRRVQRSQFELTRLSQQADTAKAIRDSSVTAAQSALATSETMFEFTRQGFLDTVKLAEYGFTVEENITKRIKNMVEGSTLAQLDAWRRDPSSAPAALQKYPGLIQAEYFSKAAKENQLIDSELALELRGYEITEARQKQFLNGLSFAQLGHLKDNPDKLPKGVTETAVNDEWRRQRSAQLALRSAALGVEKGEHEFVQMQKVDFLASLTSAEVTQMAEEAQKNGGMLEVQGVPFTMREIQDALVEATKKEHSNRLALEEIFLNGTGARALADRADSSIAAIASVVAPGVKPGANAEVLLPPDIRAEVIAQKGRVNASMAVGGTGLSKELAALNAKLDAYKTDLVKAQPEGSQAAMQEYLDKGFILNGAANADYLVDNLSNPVALNYDPAYGPVWSMFSSELNDVIGKQNQITSITGSGSTAGISVTKEGKVPNTAIVERAAKNVRNQAGGVLFQSYLTDVVRKMQKQAQAIAQQDKTAVNDIWAGLFNPRTGRFRDDAYEITTDDAGNTSRTFSAAKFSEFMARETVVLRQKGVLQPDESLNELLVLKLQQNATSWTKQHERGDINKAALNNAIFGNRPQDALLKYTMGLDQHTDKALQVVQERASLLQQETQQLINNAQQLTSGATNKSLRDATMQSVFGTAMP